jgi:dihydrofolate reductase
VGQRGPRTETLPCLLQRTRLFSNPQHPPFAPIEELIAHAKAEAAAGGKDKCVYLDGGALVRSAMDAGLVDTLTLTVIPVVLTAGVSLFTGIASRVELTLTSSKEIGGGMVQLQYDVMQQ